MHRTPMDPLAVPARRRRRARATFRPAVEQLESRVTPANVDVLTSHYDAALSGVNTQETVLTPAHVNATEFGLLFSQPTDGYVYAQPLYKANLAIAGGTHNVVFAATEHDSVYAYDADSPTAGPNGNGLYWRTSFINPAAGVTTVPAPQDVISADIVPEIGITGTPVIDGATGTLYVVAKTKEVVAGVPHYVQRLHALDITTGLDRAVNGIVTIGDTTIGGIDGGYTDVTPVVVAGAGHGTAGQGHVRFNALRELQRPALTLVNGIVYVAFASHGDNGPYHGWVVGYRASDLALVQVFNTTPNAGASGIWQSGGAPALDAAGNLYFAMGNGFSGPASQFDPSLGNYSESVLKLTPGAGPAPESMTVADYFTPFDWQTLDQFDADLGSGGTMLLPDSVGSAQHPHLMVETGKSGKIYLIDRDNMGKFTPGGPDNVVQVVQLGPAGVWGNPAYFQESPTSGLIYYQGSGDVMKAFRITGGVLSGPITLSNTSFNFPGSQPSISSNGATNAIAWALQVDGYATRQPAVLHAYAALNLSDELYTSALTGSRDRMTAATKFTFPIVTNGHVIAGANGSLSVFGLFPAATTVPTAPTNLAGTALSGTQIRLTWTNTATNATGIRVLRSQDGVNFEQIDIVSRLATSFTDGGLTPATQYFYRVVAVNQLGDSPASNTASVRTHIAAPVVQVTDVCAGAISLSWTATANDHFTVARSTDGTRSEERR